MSLAALDDSSWVITAFLAFGSTGTTVAFGLPSGLTAFISKTVLPSGTLGVVESSSKPRSIAAILSSLSGPLSEAVFEVAAGIGSGFGAGFGAGFCATCEPGFTPIAACKPFIVPLSKALNESGIGVESDGRGETI